MPLISVDDGGFFPWERGYWDPIEDEDTETDTRPASEICPRCTRDKHPENAICDDCGDVVGCALCGGTGCDECDACFHVGANHD